MIAHRVFAVLSAVFLVTAVAIAMLGPRLMSLELLLFQVDRGAVAGLKGWVGRVLGDWAWDHLFVPLLGRPAWLIPASIGLIATGLALSLSYRAHARQSRRRRS